MNRETIVKEFNEWKDKHYDIAVFDMGIVTKGRFIEIVELAVVNNEKTLIEIFEEVRILLGLFYK